MITSILHSNISFVILHLQSPHLRTSEKNALIQTQLFSFFVTFFHIVSPLGEVGRRTNKAQKIKQTTNIRHKFRKYNYQRIGSHLILINPTRLTQTSIRTLLIFSTKQNFHQSIFFKQSFESLEFMINSCSLTRERPASSKASTVCCFKSQQKIVIWALDSLRSLSNENYQLYCVVEMMQNGLWFRFAEQLKD